MSTEDTTAYRYYPRGTNTRPDLNAAIDLTRELILKNGYLEVVWRLTGSTREIPEEQIKEMIENHRNGIAKFIRNRYV